MAKLINLPCDYRLMENLRKVDLEIAKFIEKE